MWRFLLAGLLFGNLVLFSQTYGPGEIYYGGVRLQFSGQVQVMGTCSGLYQVSLGVSELRCDVQAGSSGLIMLTATRTPSGAVNIRAEALPLGWPAFPVATGFGTIATQYNFTVPSTPGQTYLLRFRAWTPGIIGELELRVSLSVRAITPPSEQGIPPTYGPFTGTTDASGKFEIPIPTVPNTTVVGILSECTARILSRTTLSVILVPKSGVTTIVRSDQIGAVRVSSPGYPETTVSQLQLLSSMDVFGRTYTTVDVGTVCLRPTAPPVTPTAPIQGRTDEEGKFTVSLPWPGVTVSGKLTVCTVTPIPNKEFALTLVPKGETLREPEDIAGFTFIAPGYQPATVTRFSQFSLLGLTWYDTGSVCLLLTETLPCRETEVRVLTQNMMLFHAEGVLGKRVCFVPMQRAAELERLLSQNGLWRRNFGIICLQEVWHFTRSGNFHNKDAVLRGWLGMNRGAGTPSILDERNNWHTLRQGEQDTNVQLGGQNCSLLRRHPRNATKAVRVAVFESNGQYAVIGPDSTPDLLGGSTYDSGLLILSKYPVIAVSAFIFSAYRGDEEFANKGVLYARIKLTSDSPNCFIHVFNTHLQAGDAKDDRTVRAQQIEQLRRFMENCTGDDRVEGKVQHPILLCGDFNIIGGSEEWQARLQNFIAAGVVLKDVWLESGKGHQPAKDAATWVGNDQDTGDTPWDNPAGRANGNVLATSGGDFQRLDYIFFWPGCQPLELELLSAEREPGKVPDPRQDKPYQWGGIQSYTLSDHLGVVGLFRVLAK
ncbi:MAG: sphingomyelin phosphodiesterase [Candidatus Bipolaricaulota bacterium]|nr:sphingomyelin phosphodiesterase [Candidatus Bipolaricaulota bacterium]MDW8126500.1 sphingomyelin phosphodiesterase [Candidatus Bipolaricaulota bacterium]